MARKPTEHFFEQIMKKPTKAITTELIGLDRMLDWLGDHSQKILDFKSTISTKAQAYLNQKSPKVFYKDYEASLDEIDALFSIGINNNDLLHELFDLLNQKNLRLKCAILCLDTLDYKPYFEANHLHLVHDETFVIDKLTYKGLVFSVYED
ncbi:MAG: hypothetical protein ACLFRI_04370 [Candidatus Izemoplasmataceae bacterium]